MTRASMTAANVARAAVEGMLCGLADGLQALVDQGVAVRRALLVGGAARSAAVRAIAPAVLGAPVVVPEPAEYVALGAARQAAWALHGESTPPAWAGPLAAGLADAGDRVSDHEVEQGRAVRENYARWRNFVHEV
jgi:xylulokinase